MSSTDGRDPDSATGEDAVAGALLGTFVGDALGARLEGAPSITDRDASQRLTGSLAADELAYTDDTQLALALTEHLCEHPRVDPDGLAATFLDHYEDWRGYGAGMHALIRLWRDGTPLDEAATAVFADGSYGNGAAMRVAPVGVLWSHDHETLVEVAARQARLTHVHPLGVAGAVTQARAVGLAARRGNFRLDELEELAAVTAEAEIATRLKTAVALIGRWDADPDLTLAAVADRLGNAVVAHRSVPAALWAAAAGADVTDTITLALGLGGDTDTIAAMTGAVVGAAAGFGEIPRGWVELLEDGGRGRSYALDLARRLAETAGRVD